MKLLKTLFPFIFGKPIVEQLSMEEILDETVNFYSKDMKLRSYIENACFYNGPNDTHCAVGRCLLPKLQLLGDKLKGNGSNLNGLLLGHDIKSLDDLLQPQYRGHNLNFWVNLQLLHDSSSNWCDTGLTDKGVLMVDRLRDRITTGEYDKKVD